MKRITPLIIIGIILIIDGIGSYLYFKNIGTTLQQLVRLFRAGIGAFILIRRRKLK